MRKPIVFLFLLCGVSTLIGASFIDYVKPDELPKTVEEAHLTALATPNAGPLKWPVDYKLFIFEPFTWKGVDWKNHLLVIKPLNLSSKNAFVYITGDYEFDVATFQTLVTIAVKNKAYVAVLFDIPNQPLFDGRYREDWLIAYTFKKFLETGDYEWPALLPMVRSTITAMNVIADYAKRNGHEIDGFILSGASKRGWTTWLTAACDERVKAIVPIAYDNLNLKDQMEHQIEFWGDYSKSISEYVYMGVLKRDLSDERRIELLKYVDPYSYRERLDIPKFIVVGTNDSYWPIDAATLYFDALPGEKSMVYAPNAGHRAEVPRAVQAVDALFVHLDMGVPLPKVEARYSRVSDTVLDVSVSIKPNGWEIAEVRLFYAHSPVRDFRKARFDYHKLEAASEAHGELELSGYTASYVEVVLERQGRKLSISTPAEVFFSRDQQR